MKIISSTRSTKNGQNVPLINVSVIDENWHAIFIMLGMCQWFSVRVKFCLWSADFPWKTSGENLMEESIKKPPMFSIFYPNMGNLDFKCKCLVQYKKQEAISAATNKSKFSINICSSRVFSDTFPFPLEAFYLTISTLDEKQNIRIEFSSDGAPQVFSQIFIFESLLFLRRIFVLGRNHRVSVKFLCILCWIIFKYDLIKSNGFNHIIFLIMGQGCPSLQV